MSSINDRYVTGIIKNQLASLMRVRNQGKKEIIKVAKQITVSQVRPRSDQKVGIMMHFNTSLLHLTNDTISQIAEKAIDNVEIVLQDRSPMSSRVFKSSSFCRESFFRDIETIERLAGHSMHLRKAKDLQKDLINTLLAAIAKDYGIFDFSQEHSVRCLMNKNIAVVVSMDHYRKAHYLAKYYGFRNCNIMMSFALAEYLSFTLAEYFKTTETV